MTAKSRRNKLRAAAFFCGALLVVVFWFGEFDLRRRDIPTDPLWKNTAVFISLVLLIPFMVKAVTRKGKLIAFLARSEIRNLLLLTVLTVIPRVIWGLKVPPRIESDYGLYVRMGRYFAENGKPEIDNYMLAVAPNTVTYSVLTGLLMRLFGTSAATLVVFTEILHFGNIPLMYAVGRKLTSVPRAFTAAAVFALLPENVMYSSLPGIEAPAIFTTLAGLLLILNGRESRTASGIALCCRGAAVLMFSACIRPNAYAVLIMAAVLLLQGNEPSKQKGRRLLALAAGAAIVFGGYQTLRAGLFAGKETASGLGWSLYEGLDMENGGKWTEEKSRRCIEVIEQYPPKEADAIFRKEGLERFGNYTFQEKLLMFIRKGGAFWYESRYAAFSLEGTDMERKWTRFADFGWAFCLAALAAGLLYGTVHPGRRKACCIGLMSGIILLTAAWHCIGTSIGRYHYMLIPFVLLLVFVLLPGGGEPILKEKSVEK